jgi:tRNA (cytidine32/uridine32-2'-O)-methyltransferase
MPPPFDTLNNISVVLVEPSSSGNIGAVARVLKNTGLTHLSLVNPSPWDNLEARSRAHGSKDILDSCSIFPDLASAVAETHIVIGTTHRIGRYRQVESDPRSVVAQLAPMAKRHKVALVFGREKDGLWRDELALCHHLLRFPSATSHPSFNLSHAVMLLAYEFFYTLQMEQAQPARQHLATSEERLHLYANLESALSTIDFKPFNDNTNNFRRVIRRFFNRAPLEKRDALVIHRICSQIHRFSEQMRKKLGKVDGAESSQDSDPPV